MLTDLSFALAFYLIISSILVPVDETVLASDSEEIGVLAVSFWNGRENADRYHREQSPKINDMLASLLETNAVRTFNVHTSTTPACPQAKPPSRN